MRVPAIFDRCGRNGTCRRGDTLLHRIVDVWGDGIEPERADKGRIVVEAF